MSSFVTSTPIGIDIGSQRTMIVSDSGEIIRTSTGSISRPTLLTLGSASANTNEAISLSSSRRLFGEESHAQLSSEYTVGLLNLLLGKSIQDVESMPCFSHKKVGQVITEDENNRVQVSFMSSGQALNATVLLGMFISHLMEQINQFAGPEASLCFVLPPNYSSSLGRAYLEASNISGIPSERVFLSDAADCLVAAYARKLAASGGSAALNLQDKFALLVDMGHTQTTAVVVRCSGDDVEKVGVSYSDRLGANDFDLALFEHFSRQVHEKYATKIEPGSKRGTRLLSGCERIRKLLSQLGESQITVENLVDSGDVQFTLRRDEMSTLCSELLARFKALLETAVTAAGNVTIDAFEVCGGGVRMPVVQQLIQQVMSISESAAVLGAKLDDGSFSVGAALLFKKQSIPTPLAAGSEATPMDVVQDNKQESASTTIGLTPVELEQARALELSLQAKDNEVRTLQSAYNKLESYILEMRNAPRQKFGSLIDASRLNSILDENESWLWDFGQEATLDQLQVRDTSLREGIQGICEGYFKAVEEERQRVELELQVEAAKAAAEKAENGDEDGDDHDTRKLKKADRMRMVVKNKEEGTELFKGGNFRPAAARYQKALTHASKFFDLTKEDESEVNQLKITLYCNLASCYIKLENWELVQRNCDDALKLDSKCVKALFRRGSFYEQKKEWELACKDYKQCMDLNEAANVPEDKLISKSLERVKKEIQKIKDKEKKMWGKAFS